jgi:formylglycine-generating enzyme required for sulfatase activity
MSATASQRFALITAAIVSACTLDTPEIALRDIEMAPVPEGPFLMGNASGPPSAKPAHEVFLHSFQIQMTEVTISQFHQYVLDSGNTPLAWQAESQPAASDLPVSGILWKEAAAFCLWYGLRLPTEAEWEKAARGPDAFSYPWGNTWDSSRANTSDAGAGHALPVSSFSGGTSPYGLFNMSGNVQEWVADYFDPAYYQTSPLHDPLGPTLVLDHGLRGGSWASPPDQASTFFRNSSHSVLPNNTVGFRCAADAAPQ